MENSHSSHSSRHSRSRHADSSRLMLLAVPFLVILLLVTIAAALNKKQNTERMAQQQDNEAYVVDTEEAMDDESYEDDMMEDENEDDMYEDQAAQDAETYVVEGMYEQDSTLTDETMMQEEPIMEDPQQFVVQPVPDNFAARLTEIRANNPTNPSSVVAKSGPQAGAVTLTSGQTYSYTSPVFTWSGAATKRTNTRITGYLVYFGTSTSPSVFRREARLQAGATYVASNMVRGRTYFLQVEAVSNDENPLYTYGMERDGSMTRTLFTYRYQ